MLNGQTINSVVWARVVKHKRGNRNIDRRLRPREIYELITMRTLSYKTTPDFYHARDKALLSLLYLTAGRITEVLRLKKSQFDSETDKDFIIIRDMQVVKRRKETLVKYGVPLREVPLPLKGQLSHFTRSVTDYLKRIEDEAMLFPSNKKANLHMSRIRAWQIVNGITDQWCHYFRSQAESHYGRVFKDVIALSNFVRVVNVQTLSEYVKTSWEDYRTQLSQ
jgi:site-specific recombinase XerD